jgi:hypothetical protein
MFYAISPSGVFASAFLAAFALWRAVGAAQERVSLISSRAESAASRKAQTNAHLSEQNEAVLQRLCALRQEPHHSSPHSHSGFDDGFQSFQFQQVENGIKNGERLLPIAKQLALASLRDLSARFEISEANLRTAGAQIDAVNSIALDEDANDAAWVSDEDPTRIYVGAAFALDLRSDENAVFLLAHELAHVAAMNENLHRFIQNVARYTVENSDISLGDEQTEDLACDFIGEQTLVKFIRAHATNEATPQRLAHALDYSCYASGDESDEEHLSESDTLRALLVLDPKLGSLILE